DWRDFFRPALAQEIAKKAGEISLHIVPASLAGRNGTKVMSSPPVFQKPTLEPKAFLGSLVFSAGGLGASLLLNRLVGVSNVALVLLIAVLASAVTFGLWPSLFAGLICALAYNFFFLAPYYSFSVADPENIITLLVFVLVAAIASNLTARVRTQAIVAR